MKRNVGRPKKYNSKSHTATFRYGPNETFELDCIKDETGEELSELLRRLIKEEYDLIQMKKKYAESLKNDKNT